MGYAAGQVLAKAVTETKSLDHDKLAAYIHANKFDTVVGTIAFGKDGEWTEARQFTTQVQNVAPNNLDQFRDGSKTAGAMAVRVQERRHHNPYADARKGSPKAIRHMRSRRRKAAALFLGMSHFVRKEQIASQSRKQIARENFVLPRSLRLRAQS